MYCPKCGNEVKPNSRFCVNCGNIIEGTSENRNVDFSDGFVVPGDFISDKLLLKADEIKGHISALKNFEKIIFHLEELCRGMAALAAKDSGESREEIIRRCLAEINSVKELKAEYIYDFTDLLCLLGKTEELLNGLLPKKDTHTSENVMYCRSACPAPSASTPTYVPQASSPKTEWGVKGAPKTPWYKRIWARKPKNEDEQPEPETFTIPECLNDLDGLEQVGENSVNPPEMDRVQFSAVVKKEAEQSEYINVDIIMYEDEFRKVVEERLEESVKETRSGYHKVAESSKIKVILSSKDIDIDDGEEERIWQGKYLEFGFVVSIPEDYPKKQVQFCASVYIDDLIATRLKFFVGIKSEEEKIKIQREDITTAFVSYASKDRDRVASIIQGMQKVRPDMDVFFDVETLRSGQRWEEELRNEIDKRSVFFLCWSKAASESKWVDFEWRYALEIKGDECIEPIPIEPPEACPPPPELKQKHFNDKLVYMIKALEYMKDQLSGQTEGDTEN